MTKPQEFTIKVQSEDPTKKDKPSNVKPDLAGSSKLSDAKDGDSEELVRDYTIRIRNIFIMIS
jgi:26S proteasome regulatory subunit N1